MPEYRSRLEAALADRFLLERELGRGGTATVWLARDLRQGRQVALKVLHPELAASLGADRFLREIDIAAGLSHPNILPLHESGETGGVLYYIMPYVENETLRDRLRREIQLPVDEAIALTCEIADALGYAHARGVVHRDIKPENILLEAGHAVVADFGVARAIGRAAADRLTETGLAVGTPAYMSPEQAGGSDHLDGRSDIYSLGCVLYEMLAGEPPFSARTPQALAAKHLQATPEPIRVVRATVPVHIERAVERALAKVPADRYSTAAEFTRALNQVVEDAGVDRQPLIRLVPRYRHAMAWTVGATAFLGLVGLLVRIMTAPRVQSLDSNRVVVFPLQDAVGGVTDGKSIAIYIGYALDRSEPLKWLDGWDQMSERERSGVSEISMPVASKISRRQRARYYIDGSIVRLRDSIAVVLRLHDVSGDSIVARAGAAAASPDAALPRLGVIAVEQLLPALLEPGRTVDLSELRERRPAAVALFLQGEREYRRMRFQSALGLYRQAIDLDSALTVAVLKGAQAAFWQQLDQSALELTDTLLLHQGTLPTKYVAFAQGLRALLTGEADSAVSNFRTALRLDSTWVEGWTALGEVYTHLLPAPVWPEPTARTAFLQAEHLDSLFSPALFHLAQEAARDHDVGRTEDIISRLSTQNPQSTYLGRLEAMVRCVRDGAESVDWAELSKDAATTLAVARALSVGGSQLECARLGYQSVFRAAKSDPSERWGALLGLQGVFAAEARLDDLRRLLDSEDALRLGGEFLYLVLGAAGVSVGEQPDRVAASISGDLGLQQAPNLWALGEWQAKKGDAQGLHALVRAMSAKVDSSKSRQDSLILASLEAQLSLLQRDTASALKRFSALRSSAAPSDLEWQPWEALAPERIAFAKLLLSAHNFSAAMGVAAQFDSPQPVLFLVYLRESLSIRVQAAEGMRRNDLARLYRTRLSGLVPISRRVAATVPTQ